MQAKQITLQGRLIGASEVRDFESGALTGQIKLTIGVRTSEGKFRQTDIKADRVNVSDFESLFDEKVEVVLEDVSISTYTNGNRAALSIKANYASIELA